MSGREGGRRGGRGKGATGVVKSLLGRIHVCVPRGARKGCIGEPGAGGEDQKACSHLSGSILDWYNVDSILINPYPEVD